MKWENDAQVFHPQILTLVVMACGAWVSLNLCLGGNAVALITLGSQVVIGLTNATITGGVFAMAAWLPPAYVQVRWSCLFGTPRCCMQLLQPPLFTFWWLTECSMSAMLIK
jgi:hypothetical protein